jgi:LacI family transcriptional regulator
MAVGAMEALAELGIDVPGEISVMGYDDQEIARYTRPALSTCILPSYDMGRWAAETLIDMAAHGGGKRTVQLKMDCPLVLRRSAGTPCPDIGSVIARAADRIFHGPTSKPVYRSFSWSSLIQEVSSPA